MRPHHHTERHSPPLRSRATGARSGAAQMHPTALVVAPSLPPPGPAAQPSRVRCEVLRRSLATLAGLLAQRRAAEIAERDIDDCVALGWLEWQGGSLRWTTTGDNLHRQLLAQDTVASWADTPSLDAAAMPARNLQGSGRRKKRGL